MSKFSIKDWGWTGEIAGRGVFLAVGLLVLYVWLTSMRPFPNNLLSALFYYGFLIALVAGVVKLLTLGFTCRRSEIDSDGLVVHEGYYGLLWKKRAIPKSQIVSVEQYEWLRPVKFGRYTCSAIRVHLSDGTAIVLAEADGAGKHHREVGENRRVLWIGD